MPSTVTVPDFRHSGFYYHEILEDLIQYTRINLPELTDEDPAEPYMQLLRAFSLSAHTPNVLLDTVAAERFLPTARLRESVAAHLALIGVELDQATPATTDLVMKLSKIFDATTLLVPDGSKFATQAKEGISAVVFEVLTDLSTGPTNEIDHLLSHDESAAGWTTHDVSVPPWTPGWGADPGAGDCLYIGHEDVMWNDLKFTLDVASQNIVVGVWEYYDGDYEDDVPDSVTPSGGGLELVLNGWLGDDNREGTAVRVRCNVTGAYEDVAVTRDGSDNEAITTTTLGQGGSPSTDPGDYTVGSLWDEVPDVVDETLLLTQSGTVTFTLPQTAMRNWIKAVVGPSSSQATAYWIRFRIIEKAGTVTKPTIDTVEIHNGSQYVLTPIMQGESQADDPLGSSNGQPNQSLTLSNYPVVDDATLLIYVTESAVESEWTQVTDFLNSSILDKHFTVGFDNDGRATVTFGDGVNGKIPDSGTDNIRATYRTLDTEGNGNVGAGTIIVNRSGIAYADILYNPRAATGYQAAEGSTAASLAQAKVSGPATLRTRARGVTADDVEYLAAEWKDSTGSKPIVRAFAIEEGNGPKTVRLITVGQGGLAVDQEALDDLDDYFNGNDVDEDGVLLMNHELTSVNFTPKPIGITVTVTGGNQTQIETQLQALLSPIALKTDGLSYEWEPGGSVTRARIIAEIMNTTPPPSNVDLTAPAADVPLAAEELPTAGVITVTVV